MICHHPAFLYSQLKRYTFPLFTTRQHSSPINFLTHTHTHIYTYRYKVVAHVIFSNFYFYKNKLRYIFHLPYCLPCMKRSFPIMFYMEVGVILESWKANYAWYLIFIVHVSPSGCSTVAPEKWKQILKQSQIKHKGIYLLGQIFVRWIYPEA